MQLKILYNLYMEYDRAFKFRVIKYTEEATRWHRLKVNISTIIAWRKCCRVTGDVKMKICRPVNKKIILEKHIEYVEAHPDAYLNETTEVSGCHPSSVLKQLRKLRL